MFVAGFDGKEEQMIKSRIQLISLMVLAVLGSSTYAGPKVTLGKKVPANHQVKMDDIDHADWDRLLKTYVDQRGQVNYKSWKKSRSAVQRLDRYVNLLSTASQSTPTSRNGQLAYWINAYNAVTIKGILREYPTSSIRNHTAQLYGYNIWNDLLLITGERKVSLEQIEHKILRKMDEPRIHFAIVCASKGCPRLLNEAYTKENLDDQLETNTRDFFANRNNFQYDASRRKIRLSSIMKWFKEDFGATPAERLRWIAPYLPEKASRQAAANNRASVSYLSYDWDINEQ